MRNFLLGLAVATVTFIGGIYTAQIFNAKDKVTSKPVAVETKLDEIPLFEIGQLEKAREIETSEMENLYGWYQLKNYKNLKEVQMISLSNDYSLNDDGTRSETKVSSAGVFTSFEKHGDQGFINSAWSEVTDKTAKFRTNKIKNIEYRFEGTFYKNKTSGTDGEKVLRGTLQKFVKGKKVAEVSGDFAYYEPHCWH